MRTSGAFCPGCMYALCSCYAVSSVNAVTALRLMMCVRGCYAISSVNAVTALRLMMCVRG